MGGYTYLLNSARFTISNLTFCSKNQLPNPSAISMYASIAFLSLSVVVSVHGTLLHLNVPK